MDCSTHKFSSHIQGYKSDTRLTGPSTHQDLATRSNNELLSIWLECQAVNAVKGSRMQYTVILQVSVADKPLVAIAQWTSTSQGNTYIDTLIHLQGLQLLTELH